MKGPLSQFFVNGKEAKAKSKVRAGDEIEIRIEESVPQKILPQNIPLKVIFENEDAIVIDKECGMVTHPAAGNWSGTLVNALLFYLKKDAIEIFPNAAADGEEGEGGEGEEIASSETEHVGGENIAIPETAHGGGIEKIEHGSEGENIASSETALGGGTSEAEHGCGDAIGGGEEIATSKNDGVSETGYGGGIEKTEHDGEEGEGEDAIARCGEEIATSKNDGTSETKHGRNAIALGGDENIAIPENGGTSETALGEEGEPIATSKTRFSNAAFLESLRPGIVHRLDKDTSGVIIAAKTERAKDFLSRQFSERTAKKEYVLIVKGRPPKKSGKIETLIIRDPKDRKKYKAADAEEIFRKKNLRYGEDAEKMSQENFSRGKRAVTLYSTIKEFPRHTLLRASLLTGRTHQIRVHMKHLGCPVLGDALYSKADKDFPNAALMLHSRSLEIFLPGESEKRLFKAALPKRFWDVLKALERGGRFF